MEFAEIQRVVILKDNRNRKLSKRILSWQFPGLPDRFPFVYCPRIECGNLRPLSRRFMPATQVLLVRLVRLSLLFSISSVSPDIIGLPINTKVHFPHNFRFFLKRAASNSSPPTKSAQFATFVSTKSTIWRFFCDFYPIICTIICVFQKKSVPLRNN